MTPHYLKFPDEATAIAKLPDFRGVAADEAKTPIWLTSSHTHALDAVGTHFTATGVTLHDEDGNPYPEMIATAGFHINFLGDLPAEAVPYEIFPATPSRVWA